MPARALRESAAQASTRPAPTICCWPPHTGWHQLNEEQQDFNQATIGLTAYRTTGHFIESVFENGESEFLQMACYLTLPQ